MAAFSERGRSGRGPRSIGAGGAGYNPLCVLTPAYWENRTRPAQVRAFARRAGLTVPENPGHEFTELLGAFLLPVLEDLQRGVPGTGFWGPGGPWLPAEPEA